LDEGLAEPDAEDLRRVDPAVDAGDDVQVQVRDEREPGPALARADAERSASRSIVTAG